MSLVPTFMYLLSRQQGLFAISQCETAAIQKVRPGGADIGLYRPVADIGR
jgi:hypothetical protein